MDITYIPMARGFIYLAAVLDCIWPPCWTGSPRPCPGMAGVDHAGGGFCMEAVEAALARHGTPGIFNTDQGFMGGFNRSSQHLDLARRSAVRPGLLPVSSISGLCEVFRSVRPQQPRDRQHCAC